MIQNAGWKVPDDAGWVHLDWLPECKPSADVYGNSEHTGAAAVELVVSQLHRGEAGPPAHAMSYLVSARGSPARWCAALVPHSISTPRFSPICSAPEPPEEVRSHAAADGGPHSTGRSGPRL